MIINRTFTSVAYIALLLLFGCQNNTKNAQHEEVNQELTGRRELAKFEPEDGKCILFVGQELEAIGGLDRFDDGYFDYFQAPGGFTMYTDLSPGDEMFGYTLKGLDGIFTTDDWGDSESNMSLQLADEDFAQSALAIGLSMVNHEKMVAEGVHDGLIDQLAAWLMTLGARPVFLRIGYEFSGAWNNYDREAFLKAYRRIKDRLDAAGVDNVAYVWQSHGWGEPTELLESWYPGDKYVDWCAYSFFNRWDEANMIEFARKKGKPVFIAEATPTISAATAKTDGKTKETILSKADQAQEAWDEWFVPFFKTIDENPDVVKAISYINCHWKSHPMWFDNPTFQDIDARLQISPMIREEWIKETSKPKFLKASPTLFDDLWRKN